MKSIPLICASLFLCVSSAWAQNRNRNSVPKVTPEEAFNNYHFEEAANLLEAEIQQLKRRRRDTEEQEQMLAQVNKFRLMLQATEKVIIIDSVVVNKDRVFGHLQLSDECGTIMVKMNRQGQEVDSLGTSFENQLGNKQIYAQPNARGKLRLYEKNKVGNEWNEGAPLKGLEEDENDTLNFPFMLTDGMTLYFASNSEEGLGGHDIYMTRYDSDRRAYLSPDNIGMPFNSPANDYLMIIDEYYDLGWFVTDRNQPEGFVCIYTFIPNETRQIYQDEEVDDEKLARLAMIHSIKDTWTDMAKVNAALQRLQALRSARVKDDVQRDFEFVVNDTHVYYNRQSFKNVNAQRNVDLWVEANKNLEKSQAELDGLRLQYQTGNQEKRAQISPQIRMLEGRIDQLKKDIYNLENTIRKFELNK